MSHDLANFRHFGKTIIVTANSNPYGNPLRAFIECGEHLHLLWQMFGAFGHIFLFENGPRLTKNIIAIWSRWLRGLEWSKA